MPDRFDFNIHTFDLKLSLIKSTSVGFRKYLMVFHVLCLETLNGSAVMHRSLFSLSFLYYSLLMRYWMLLLWKCMLANEKFVYISWRSSFSWFPKLIFTNRNFFTYILAYSTCIQLYHRKLCDTPRNVFFCLFF